MPHALPALPYGYDALEPSIDARTMEIHHTKHHQTYVDKLNAALAPYPTLADRSLEDLLPALASLDVPETVKKAIRNHGGGHANHSRFWQIMGPTKAVDQSLVEEITRHFGSVDGFKAKFADLAATLFGSGWVWLTKSADGALDLAQYPNQDSPLMTRLTPVLGLDVWEHAYYLRYQNKRPDYIKAWWSVVKILP